MSWTLEKVDKQKFYPLHAPGMPAPGPSFLAYAEQCGDQALDKKSLTAARSGKRRDPYGDKLTEIYRRCLYSRGELMMPMQVKPGRKKQLNVVSGHIWGDPDGHGPRRADVMIIGKMLGEEERNHGSNFVGPTGKMLKELLLKYDIPFDDFYVTNVLKTEHPDNGNGFSLKWVEDWKPLLHQELRLVRPKYILCLGADACQAVLGKQANLKWVEGRIIEHTFPIDKKYREEGEARHHTSLVMGCTHPAAVLRMPEMGDKLDDAIARFGQMIRGVRWDQGEDDLDHRIIDNIEELRALEKEIRKNCDDNMIAVDAEWHSDHPVNDGAYIRTIQLSWKHKTAVCIRLRNAGGKKAFHGKSSEIAEIVTRILKGRKVVGQFLNADAEWLVPFGIDIPKMYRVPKTWQEYQDAWHSDRACGFDTGLAWHAANETGDFGLTAMTLRFTSAPRYDVALDAWKKAYCLKHKIKEGNLEGYGECPNEVLEPYACLDYRSQVQLADGTWRSIGELVNRRYRGKVKALLDGKVVDARVIDWHRAEAGQKDWRQVRTAVTKQNGNGFCGPVFTPDHKVVTRRGKVRVDELQIGVDAIATDEPALSSEQLSIILGSAIGDGGFRAQRTPGSAAFSFSQCIERGSYADWKADALANFNPIATHDETRRRYRIPASRTLSEVFRTHPRRPNHSKHALKITPELLKALGMLGLAVWYQDDGSLKSETACQLYAKLNDDEVAVLIPWLRKQFGNEIDYVGSEKSRYISIKGGSFNRFQAAIHPYAHPAFNYKLSQSVKTPVKVKRSSDVYYDTVTDVVVKDYGKAAKHHTVRYCLTVEKAHNFLTKVGFVSNCYDADVTRRIAVKLGDILDADRFGNNCWEAFWRNMSAYQAVYEINTTGIPVDRNRLDRLAEVYLSTKENIRTKILEWSRWDSLNIDSVNQIREWMFGERFNGAKRDDPNVPRRLRPKGAKSMYLTPVMSNDKRPVMWDDVVSRGQENEKLPSTKGQALSILQQQATGKGLRKTKSGRRITVNVDYAEQIGWLRDYRYVGQILKTTLRPPKLDENQNYVEDDDGHYTYEKEKGLPASICDDGRIRTHIYPTLETCRWASSRPNLTNVSKRREKDYKRILGDKYKWPLRTIFKTPPGYVLVEADFVGAELFGAAVMSGDAAMIDHCRRNQLPETHPDYYDIHSQVAVRAFRLKCAPTKAGLETLGRSNLRIVAKSVIFGLMYGRAAKAISIAAQEEKIPLTKQEAQQIIDTIFEMYPKLEPFFAACRERAIEYGWMCNCFGQMRRFPPVLEEKQIGEFERQAMNFPMQSLVAGAMSQALCNLMDMRDAHPVGKDLFKIALQIHDAVLLLVPVQHVATVMDDFLVEAMCNRVPIYRTGLDGIPLSSKPYYMGVDANVYEHWGEQLMPDRCKELGFSPKYAGFHLASDGKGWCHREIKSGQKWLNGSWVPLAT